MSTAKLTWPDVILFDWHGTLVDTHDAMFAAMEEVLSQFEELGLVRHLLPEDQCRTADDIRLVRYIRIYRHLHPTILAERRISRTEIFNAIFGENEEAKQIAHEAYNACYARHFGEVHPYQAGITEYLTALRKLGIRTGVATNRSRAFLDAELKQVEGGAWQALLDVIRCADDVARYKPHPDVIHAALEALGHRHGPVWYVGDSRMDMLTAHNARVTPLFYNGAWWDEDWIADHLMSEARTRPARILPDFEALMATLESVASEAQREALNRERPPAAPPPPAPPPRQEPDWHPAIAKLQVPRAILFDWHATLADTLDAMYNAVDDLLEELEELDLLDRLVPEGKSRSPEDAKLVAYVREHYSLHPKVKADRKISRTDIFEVLFGDDEEAKQIAHRRFNFHYRNYFGNVLPFEPGIREMLTALRELPILTGVMTNRDREFFEHELQAIDGTGWAHFFDCWVCGDDTERRKPHPDPLFKACEMLDIPPGRDVWYVGDSTTDIIAASRAGMTGVFYNGAQWDQRWLNTIFPRSERFPWAPDVVVNSFSEFWAMLLTCMSGP